MLVLALGCGGGGTTGADASVDGGMDAAQDTGSDASAEASCGPPDLSACGCTQPKPQCCASIDSEPPSCKLTSGGPLCLPDCYPESFGCTSNGGMINVIRPMCTTAADCTPYAGGGYTSCCIITCQPHLLAICVSPTEATTSNLSCL
jgi:hypothetical protein